MCNCQLKSIKQTNFGWTTAGKFQFQFCLIAAGFVLESNYETSLLPSASQHCAPLFPAITHRTCYVIFNTFHTMFVLNNLHFLLQTKHCRFLSRNYSTIKFNKKLFARMHWSTFTEKLQSYRSVIRRRIEILNSFASMIVAKIKNRSYEH